MQIFRATWIAHCTTVLWFSSSTVLVHIPIILLLAMVLVKKRKERKSSVGFLFSFALPHTDGDVRASRWDFSLIFALCSRGGFLLPASPSLTLWYFADALPYLPVWVYFVQYQQSSGECVLLIAANSVGWWSLSGRSAFLIKQLLQGFSRCGVRSDTFLPLAWLQ